jgi:hypothetical protein
MSLKWTRGRFLIALHPDAEHDPSDTGIRFGHVSGPFGVHAIMHHRRSWRLTHIPSGHCIADGIDTLVEAKALAEEVLPLANWNQKNPLEGLSDEQRRRIRCVVMGEEKCAS